MFDVSGKVAVITGATGVLCGAMARHLAKQGVKVVLVGRSQDKGQELEREINQNGGTALFVAADVLDKEAVSNVRDAALDKFGKIDILINGAGGNRPDATATAQLSFFDIPYDALRSVFDLNLLGTVLPTQIIGKAMAGNNEGVIINISSMAAERPMTRVVGYAAAKAAIDNFTKWLSVYMNHNVSPQIRVNAIAPGFFLTEQNYYLLIDEKTGAPTPRGEQILSHTPMGRYGEPEDLLGALQWLISDGAKFVTGTVIPVDGGFSAYSGV